MPVDYMGTDAAAATNNRVLQRGYIGYTSDTAVIKVGDGVTGWNALTAAGGGGGGLTQEQIEDLVGAMATGNTETGITVTYDDALGKFNFVAAPSFIIPFTVAAPVAAAGTRVLMNPTGRTLVVEKIAITKTSTVVGTDFVIDANVNGTTIYTTQANRPKIVIGATAQVLTGSLGVPDGTANWANNNGLTIDVDTAGSDTGDVTGAIVVH
jgi:hypothetical protein